KNKLIFILIRDKKIVFFNKRLIVFRIINIENLKNIKLKGKYTIEIKFFTHDGIELVNLKLFSDEDRDILVSQLLPDCVKFTYNIFVRVLLFNILKTKVGFFNQVWIKLCTNISDLT